MKRYKKKEDLDAENVGEVTIWCIGTEDFNDINNADHFTFGYKWTSKCEETKNLGTKTKAIIVVPIRINNEYNATIFESKNPVTKKVNWINSREMGLVILITIMGIEKIKFNKITIVNRGCHFYSESPKF